MAINEVAALGRTLLQFVSAIQDLGNNYFQSEGARRAFPSRVVLLQATHEGLQETLEKYGINQDNFPSLIEVVKEAKRLLDGEVAKLERRRSRADSHGSTCTCCSIRGILFPVSVDTHLRVAEGVYSRIKEHLQTQLQNEDNLRDLVGKQHFLPPVRNDGHYVPLQISMGKIISALERPGSRPAVVLLCGGKGKGKSALAKQIILRYTQREPNGNPKFFFPVVMLECGPDVDIGAKQTELLQKLGGDLPQQMQNMELEILKKLGVDVSHIHQSKEDDVKVLKSLQHRLTNKRMLIVLDDLWEPQLLQRLVNLGGPQSGAKYLVTSQQDDICDGFHTSEKTVIPIEDICQDDSRKILASYVGFEGQEIPRYLQELADKIISQAEANPSVLAKLGVFIAKAGEHQVEVWEDVSEHMLALLEDGTLIDKQ